MLQLFWTGFASKQKIELGSVEYSEYSVALNAIKYIESESDHLKHFMGFKRAKRLILDNFRDIVEE